MVESNDTLQDIWTRFTGWVKVDGALILLRLRESQWLLALIASILGSVIGFYIIKYSVQISTLFPRGTWVITVTEARSVLLAFIGVEITALSIVMSLTMITVQNASSQFSHRLLRYYLRDLVQQSVFAVIAGSTAYFVTVAAFLGFDRSELPVSRPSLGLAVLFLVASGVALIIQVNHTLQIIRLEVVLIRVVSVTERAIDVIEAAYEDTDFKVNAPLPISDSAIPVEAHHSGYISYEDAGSLLELAQHHHLLVRLDLEIGNYAVKGTPIGWIQPDDPNAEIPDTLLMQISESMGIIGWRNPKYDIGLGIRILVDIAIKALSPAINDPYTAVKSIDHISTVFIHLFNQQLGDKTLYDQSGHPRVQLHSPTFLDYLTLATDQIIRYGSKEPAVVERLLKLVKSVGLVVTSQPDKAAVLQVRDRIMAEAERLIDDPEWLKTLRGLAAETERAIIYGPSYRSKWVIGL